MAFRIAFLSAYPPARCQLATFTQAMVNHLARRPDVVVGVVSVAHAVHQQAPEVVAHQLVTGQQGSVRRAAAVLDGYNAVVVQHGFGIHEREDADVLEVMRDLQVPVITVLTSVPVDPSPHEYHVVDDVVRASSVVVTMAETARQRLVWRWNVSVPVRVIPRGAEPNPSEGREPRDSHRPTILTWGLLRPGKGIEWAIEALSGLRDLPNPPLYRVVGQTHPRARERDGEAYRDGLVARARAFRVGRMVAFHDEYVDSDSLRAMVRDCEVVLLPYDSREKVTSGVLTEAVVAGKPIVATAFPHARELLSDGAGIIVRHRDPNAMRVALRRVLTEPGLAHSMTERSRAMAPSLHWSAISAQYLELARGLRTARTVAVAS